jgi:hypothetical protein
MNGVFITVPGVSGSEPGRSGRNGQLRVQDDVGIRGVARTGVDLVADAIDPDLKSPVADDRPVPRPHGAVERPCVQAEPWRRDQGGRPRLGVAELIAEWAAHPDDGSDPLDGDPFDDPFDDQTDDPFDDQTDEGDGDLDEGDDDEGDEADDDEGDEADDDEGDEADDEADDDEAGDHRLGGDRSSGSDPRRSGRAVLAAAG